jgi:hypothetical protein
VDKGRSGRMHPHLELMHSADSACGSREITRLLTERCLDLRALDPTGFRRWLSQHLERWQHDPIFNQRLRIRELRRAHPDLRVLERRLRQVEAADAAAAEHPVLDRLAREIEGARKAVAGLTAAAGKATAAAAAPLQRKLANFQAKLGALEAQQEALVRASPARQQLLQTQVELQRLRAISGLEHEQQRLAELLRRAGQRSGGAGSRFERQALALTERHIVPGLAADAQALCIVGGVTLGAARTELDQLVVRRPPEEGQPVEVLALVEAKRNINDLAHGFCRRQENLAWLTGAADAYDPAQCRTQSFPSGHFDRPALHPYGDTRLIFTRDSFHRFRREPTSGWFLDGLYFITRPATLWGVSSAALARIAFRVATDMRWQWESDEYLADLLRWCQSLAQPLEAPDVLRAYAPQRARQILLLGRADERV